MKQRLHISFYCAAGSIDLPYYVPSAGITGQARKARRMAYPSRERGRKRCREEEDERKKRRSGGRASNVAG
jgi:hypothetical protein